MDRPHLASLLWAIALSGVLTGGLLRAETDSASEADQVAQQPGKAPPTLLPETKVEAPPIAPPAPVPPPPAPTPELPRLPASPFAPPPVPGYRAPTAVTGTGTDTPLLNIPASVDVVPRAVIVDQQALRTEDLLRNVGGAAANPSPITRFNQFTMRGFRISDFELRRNGFVDLSLVPRELANIERVEFLKGPAAILYGTGQPGGVVNFITRMPLAQPATYAEMQYGSFDLRRLVADSTGPVLGSDSLYYRGIVALEDSHSFRDFGLLERVLVAPSLTWRISEDTTFTVQPEFLYTRLFFDTGVVAPNGIVGVVADQPQPQRAGRPRARRRLSYRPLPRPSAE
jgi:iron complex outermembrane receptor protein